MPRKAYLHEKTKFLPQEDQLIQKLFYENEKLSEENKLKWNDIAEKICQKIQGSQRTGKQCRQRWYNQLDPSIKHTKFTKKQIQKLYRLQNQKGNRWAQIAKQMPGRTDNNVKNYFYSSLRRALRHVNKFLSKMRKKTKIKPFKPIMITKILAINDQKYKERLDIKGDEAVQIADNIKNMLLNIAQQVEDDQDIELAQNQVEDREKLIGYLQQFNKCCKKRKQKKVIQHESDGSADLQESQPQISQISQEKNEKNGHRRSSRNLSQQHIQEKRKTRRPKKQKEQMRSIRNMRTKTSERDKQPVKKNKLNLRRQDSNKSMKIKEQQKNSLKNSVIKLQNKKSIIDQEKNLMQMIDERDEDEDNWKNNKYQKQNLLSKLKNRESFIISENQMPAMKKLSNNSKKVSRMDSKQSNRSNQFNFERSFLDPLMFKKQSDLPIMNKKITRRDSNNERQFRKKQSELGFRNSGVDLNPMFLQSLNFGELPNYDISLAQSGFFKGPSNMQTKGHKQTDKI